MGHIDGMIKLSLRRESLERIDAELASQVNQCEPYGKSPLPAMFGFCYAIYC